MIGIVDYGIGNLLSIKNMFRKGGHIAEIVSKKADLERVSKILLPGMGSFDNCMAKFNASELKAEIERKVLEENVPILGICVGLQMLTGGSEEGVLPGLGWIAGTTVRFKEPSMGQKMKVPNMGWLDIHPAKPSKLLMDLGDSRFYFAHSFHVKESNTTDALAFADYGYRYTVAVEKENIIGVQFHPEKSHRFGLQLLKNFAEKY